MKTIIVGEPAFWSPNGTSTTLNLKEIPRDQFKDPNFTERDFRSFENAPIFGILEQSLHAARTYGKKAKVRGKYHHTRNLPDPITAKERLAIDPECNSCENSATIEIPAGTPIAYGKIKDGKETQIYVHSRYISDLKISEPNMINDPST